MTSRCLPESRKPVCLPPKALGLPAQSSMTVTGWGYLEENGWPLKIKLHFER